MHEMIRLQVRVERLGDVRRAVPRKARDLLQWLTMLRHPGQCGVTQRVPCDAPQWIGIGKSGLADRLVEGLSNVLPRGSIDAMEDVIASRVLSFVEPGKRGGGWLPIRRKRLAPIGAETRGPLSPENGWPPFGRQRLAPDARQRVAHYREETDSVAGDRGRRED
jgi:hypothetical protein